MGRPAALLAALLGACLDRAAPCGPGALAAGDDHTCATDGWLDRGYDVHVPATWDGTSSLPVVLMFHGGGGNRGGADRATCPRGELDAPTCLAATARARGFVVVVPDGTGGRPLRGVRTWNAGGGSDGWDCTSGAACAAGVDDVGYVGDVLAQLGTALPLDPRRVYATGLSNGAALAHRLACELPQPLAAIAAVAGANQWADTGGGCPRATPVLQVHGTDDPCWRFDGGEAGCLDDDGRKTSVAATLEGTAEPIGRGHTRIDAAIDVGTFRDRDGDTRTPAVHVELAARRGLTERTDATLKLYVPGVELGVQHALGGARWRWAVAAAIGGERTRAGVGSTDAAYGHLRLTALATRRTSARWAFTVGPVATAGVFVPAAGGWAHGLLVGAVAGVEWRFAGAWLVAPELSLHLTAAGEVPVRGAVAQLGAAIGRRW